MKKERQSSEATTNERVWVGAELRVVTSACPDEWQEQREEQNQPTCFLHLCSLYVCDTTVSLWGRWQQAGAITGQTAIKIPPTGPVEDHKGLFDTAVSYIGR